ncbi:hypothetical protein MKW92_006403 [Papaver armeniacum]|nr:hypothetical protein MKW92_006403 [Papaver armeniacum]
MGKKINPLGFRLGTTQKHHSFWFAQPKSYSEGLQEDQKIRDCIKNYVQNNMIISSGVEGIARIEIKKRIDLVQVIIYMEFPKWLIEGKPRGIEELLINVQKVAKPYGDPNILAEIYRWAIKNRVSFRKAMKKAIELTEQVDTKGIQVQITGRIDGKEIACVEWIGEGRVPLQTIRVKIYYCFYTIRTIYGVLGIKIWIFAYEK